MQLAELSWPAVERLPKDMPVVIPVAALEQHGHHLPLFTDSMLLGEVVRRLATPLGDKILFAPLQWLGNSAHHLDFAGSLSAGPRTYIDLLNDVAENFLRHGFKRIVFLNGHGGNEIPGRQACFELRQRHRECKDLLLLFATYWDFGSPAEGRPDFVQKQMGHACEWETSMILRIAPRLVGEIAKLEDIDPAFGFEPAYKGWTTKDRTGPGHIGVPRHANAEKGEHLFATFAAGLESYLGRVAAWDGRGKLT